MSDTVQSGSGFQQGDGMQNISSADDISNLQCVNFESSTSDNSNQQFVTSVKCITFHSGECYNQQNFAENLELSQSQLPQFVSMVKENYNSVSITIPVGGTLSRAPRKKIG
ncbi:hypothetical protein WUBG_13113 [Wuchereria bancrofti]|uniref:Uncharacterized protein n=1 Tax=Wuchereria bancrofti TaxID=6293 RepID=J9EKV1_WUCBA|nr:hypothetical protein WUBG_13113 [Wuchereria bancrofti]